MCANKVVYKTKSIAYLRAINKTLLFYIFISVWGGVAVCSWLCVLCIQRKPIWKFNSESNSVSIRLHVVRSSFVHWLFNRWHVDTIASMQLYTQMYMCVCVCLSIHMQHIRRALFIPRASFDKRAAKSRNLQNLCVHTCLFLVCLSEYECVCILCVFCVCFPRCD